MSKKRTPARRSARPIVPPVTAAGIVVSLLGINDLTYGRLWPLAEQELTTLFPIDGFDTGNINTAAERMVTRYRQSLPQKIQHDLGEEPTLYDHVDAAFLLGLLTGFRLAGVR